MNTSNLELAKGLISSKYISQADQARKQREARIKSLLSQVYLFCFCFILSCLICLHFTFSLARIAR